ncbi:GTPase domain-containing protein [Aquibacillus albus]|uniref:Tetratricopeptide (TPR) repeat protein n=1 Tax=Aquibacillus albus TaxID=1168171 RepID=A0ABS2MWG2_9BACI|nr:GTPase domain-containing protein [Aquibacillus albus]MBM7570227.1 tetratricopeptide (TPR) repeat protein [Aquibacillus albus]
MTLEKQLIRKSYYEMFMEGIENVHPIKVLSEMYLDEKQKEMPDLSYIRFAQGEVYFQNKDFEVAIFKWEHISNEFKPWAQKNIADAHYELDLLAIAEDYYKAVETESDVLKTEVLLQLFSLYIQRGNLEMAVDSIKKAVDLNPDYPDVTDMARAFFEDNQDWDNAVKLAVNEAIRTESLSWFEILEAYVDRGQTAHLAPNYFSEALMTLFHLDQPRFESLSKALWHSYKPNDLYFPWLKEINHLLLNIELGDSHVWKELSVLYKETYVELISGKFLIRDLSPLLPNHLSNWMKISTASDALVSSSAVLAWGEIFPSDMEDSVLSEAETMLSQSARYQDGLEDGFRLFESIVNWAEREGLSLGERFKWIVRELLDLNHYHLFIAGSVTSGKTAIMNTMLDEMLLEDSNSAAVLFKDADEAEMRAITDEEVRSISDFDDFRQSSKDEQTLIHCSMPISFLNKNRLSLLDIPGPPEQSNTPYLRLADCLLFVLNTDSYLVEKELDQAIKLSEQAPEIPVHFLLFKMDRIANSQETMDLVEQTTSKIDAYFPDAKVFALSAYEESERQLNELSSIARSIMKEHSLEGERTSKILSYIKKSIKLLFEKRVEMENSFLNKIKWNEEIVAKLQGAHHQLSDMEEEKVQVIQNSYSKIKQEWREDLLTKIPELLRNCSEMVSEDSNFGRIHIEINDEMNKRMTDYLEETALPDFRAAIQGWMAGCEAEFRDSQTYFDEMSESFNHLYGDEKLALNCDFKVLDDWRRDVDRMTRGNIQLGKVNILTQFTPSQFLLKSAGKLFGPISKNKEMLHNKYKQFIERKDYSETAKSVTDTFMQQFELFERSLERDISMFFAYPYQVLNKTLEETQNRIEENKESLSDMRKNPEIFRDPLTLFKLQLRQYEWMRDGGTGSLSQVEV